MSDDLYPSDHEHEEDPRSGFLTDQEPALEEEALQDTLLDAPPSATVMTGAPPADLSVLDMRPTAGAPREYHFPRFERFRLRNGVTLLHAHLPGRPLLAAQLLLAGGVAAEPSDRGGVTVLAARAMTEGTERLDAVAFTEAAERLGAEIHADASWEAVSATLEVPRSRFGAALALLTEMVLEPRFPAEEVERLRDERLNDLLQARADPRRRAERVFPETIYAPESPYSRPLGGTGETVQELDRTAGAERHAAALDPSRATLVVAGDLAGFDLPELVEGHLGAWSPGQAATRPETTAAAHPEGPRVVLVDRPGSPQSEVRIGHPGPRRRTPDFHAIAVLNSILGGTFDSRLNRLIREQRGYTYAIHSSFDMRRAGGPFLVRTPVETDVTVPAIVETMGVLRSIRDAAVEDAELRQAKDFLVGVFPLRFEVSSQVAAALGGLVVHELPDDELDRYRPAIADVTSDAVLDAARRHIRPDDAAIVVVGDAARVEQPLTEAGLGRVEVIPADQPSR